MFFTRVVLPAFAVAGTALAQIGCDANENIIQSQGDASALSNCATVEGDVIIDEAVAGTIQLDGVQQIRGSLRCTEAVNLTSIEANSLNSIGSNFALRGLTILSTLNFPELKEVGNIAWEALPALQQLSFTKEVTKAANVLISNTQLNSLDGINLEQVDTFNINNNAYLSSVDVQLGNITEALIIQANGKKLVASFPNLEWAFNMTFRNCSDVKLPSLASVNGSMGFFDNFFKTFSAPNLTESGGSLVFVSNSDLTNISMPNLETIGGGYQIANNSQLMEIDGFPALTTVAGAIDFSGDFSNVSLDAIQDVRGGFNMQTSGTLDCGPFDDAKDQGIIKGTYVCASEAENPGTAGNSPSSTSSANGPRKSAATPKTGVNVLAVMVLSSLVAGLLQLSL
ncbi:MAG: hypothetical protein M1817_006020 [Caeruleum heppii]|nr:MAG: hypothetical protein M1817_006020 [Caeruleum heppii]